MRLHGRSPEAKRETGSGATRVEGTGALVFALACALAFPSDAHTADLGGLQIAGAVDIVAQGGKAAPGTSGRVDAREGEIILFSPADHLFDGVFSAAAHQESGKAFFEIHEATIGTTRLIPRSRLKVGQTFLGVGRLNHFHRHDWPFVSAPRVQGRFFGEEGALDTGAEYGWLAPTSFFLDLSGGVTSGWRFGHSHDEGELPTIPTHYLRAMTYAELPGEGGIQLGGNYLGRRDASRTWMRLAGLDATAKWKDGRTLRWLFQSEVWWKQHAPHGVPSESLLGGYLYPQYGFGDEGAWFFGIRGDTYVNVSLKSASGKRQANGSHALVPTLTWKPSEFTTFRSALTLALNQAPGEKLKASGAIELQSVFILGAHPAHDF